MRARADFGYAAGLAPRQDVPSRCLLPIELKLYFAAARTQAPGLAHNNIGDGYAQQFDDVAEKAHYKKSHSGDQQCATKLMRIGFGAQFDHCAHVLQ